MFSSSSGSSTGLRSSSWLRITSTFASMSPSFGLGSKSREAFHMYITSFASPTSVSAFFPSTKASACSRVAPISWSRRLPFEVAIPNQADM